MLKDNYLIINKKPQAFSEMRIAGRTAVFIGADGKPLDFGVLPLDESIYAMMSCRQVKLVMLVTDRQEEIRVTGIFWKKEEDFEDGAARLAAVSGRRMSKQDLKISNYAWAVAKKLEKGVRIKVTDAVNESEMTVCPECGMLNPNNSPYCLDCGAEL